MFHADYSGCSVETGLEGRVGAGKGSFQGSQYQDIFHVSGMCSWMIVL